MMQNDHSLEECVNQALDDSVESLSPEIRRALNKGRHEAVERTSTRKIYFRAAGALSFAVMLTFVWQLNYSSNQTPIEVYAEIPEEDLELLDELEFMYWLAEEANSEVL
jgi:hypothetical protein